MCWASASRAVCSLARNARRALCQRSGPYPPGINSRPLDLHSLILAVRKSEERGYSGSRTSAGRNDFHLSTQGLGRVVKRTCGEQLSAGGQRKAKRGKRTWKGRCRRCFRTQSEV